MNGRSVREPVALVHDRWAGFGLDTSVYNMFLLAQYWFDKQLFHFQTQFLYLLERAPAEAASSCACMLVTYLDKVIWSEDVCKSMTGDQPCALLVGQVHLLPPLLLPRLAC